jgi:hypothetical protein
VVQSPCECPLLENLIPIEISDGGRVDLVRVEIPRVCHLGLLWGNHRVLAREFVEHTHAVCDVGPPDIGVAVVAELSVATMLTHETEEAADVDVVEEGILGGVAVPRERCGDPRRQFVAVDPLFDGKLVKRSVKLLICERVGGKKEGIMEQGALLEREVFVVGVGVRPSAHYRDVLVEVVKWGE